MLKIIVLEDEPAVRKDLVLLTPWEDLGFICVGEADNGDSGLELAIKLRPDIIMTDIRMPGRDGLQFIKAYQENCEINQLDSPEFIILSGYSEFEYARQALRLAVSEYLLKPINNEALFEALSRAKNRSLKKHASHSLIKASFQEYLEDEKTATQYDGYVERTINLIRDHFITGITIEQAALKLGISAGHLSRLFKQATGYTFVDYLVYVRIKRAIELLRDPCIKVYEVADLVGYTDARYFASVFKKTVGYTPSEFRASI